MSKKSKVAKAAKNINKETVVTPEVKQQVKEEPKVEEVHVEEIKTKEDTTPPIKIQNKEEKKVSSVLTSIGALKDGERISPDSSIALLGILERKMISAEKDNLPELKGAIEEPFNMMLIVSMCQWGNQFKNDMLEKGIVIQEGMFNKLNAYCEQVFETKLLTCNENKDKKQLTIDFKQTIENAPEDMKKAVEAEKKVQPINTLPEFSEKKNTEELLKDVRNILSMKNSKPEINFYNAITYAAKVYKDNDVASVLTHLIKDFGEDAPCLIFNGFSNMVYGTLIKSNSPIYGHSLLRNRFNSEMFTDDEIAKIHCVLLSYRLRTQATRVGGNCLRDYIIPYNTLFNKITDKLINTIQEHYTEDEPTIIKLSVPKMVGSDINPKMFVNSIKANTHFNNDKDLFTYMKQTMELYRKHILESI